MSRVRAWWPVLVLALVPLIPLWRAVFLGEAIGPWDQIRHMAPWKGPAPAQPWDVLQADAVLQFAGWRSMVFEAWGSGQIPAWNPYSLCGTPLLANSQSGGFYPPHILLGLLHVPLVPALTLLAWFHLFVAGLGMRRLCLRLGGEEWGAVLGGVLFATSTFLIAWTALPSVVSTCAWIPWVLAGVAFVQRDGWRRIPWVSVPGAMMLLGGHLQFAAYGLMAATVFALWRPLGEWRTAAATLAALAFAGCLAAPQLLPTIRFGEFSHRQNAPTAEGYDAYVAGALQPMHAIGLVYPPLLGMPTEGIAMEGSPGTQLPLFWPAFAQRGANFAESALGIGPLVLALLFVPGLFRNPQARTGGMAALGVLGLLLAFGSPLDRVLYFFAPGWSATGSPGRAGVLFVIAACALAGLAASAGKVREGKGLRGPIGALALATLVSIAGLRLLVPTLGAWVPGGNGLVGQIAAEGTPPWLAASLLACLGTLAAVVLWTRGKAVSATLLPAAILVPIVLGAGTLLRTSADPNLREAVPKTTERIAVVNAQWELLTPAPALLPPNTGVLSRLHEVSGYDSLLHRDTVAMLREIDGQDPAPPTNGNMMLIKPGFDEEKLADAGVSQVWEPLRPDEAAPAVRIRMLQTQGRAFTPQGPAKILDEGYDFLVVEASGAGPLVVRDRNMPGWSVVVDGVPSDLKGGRWREVELLSEGNHRVVMRYTPPGLREGTALAGGALLVLLLLTALGRRGEITQPIPVVQ
ncbi:MAG: hypothetical protein H6534_04760 [Chthonomonadaceae bacterium]|nr:hypothetical protein [Chthonomonadaceae bacterium]